MDSPISKKYIGINFSITNVSYFSYPPFDPFNTTYIPLPGPSSPRFALPLSGGNPHMVSGAESALFRRPIRQSLYSPVLPATRGLRSQFSGPDPENDVFKYQSSNQFEASELGRFFRSKNRSVPKWNKSDTLSTFCEIKCNIDVKELFIYQFIYLLK